MKNKALERLHYYWTFASLPQQVTVFRRNAKKKPRELAEIQKKKIKLIIRHAYDHNPFYHRLFRERGVDPNDIRTLGDFRKIPTISRKTVQQNLPQMISNNVDLNYCYRRKTSGSSGIPLTVLTTHNAGLQRWICTLRQFLECGGKWKDTQLEFRNVDDIRDSGRKKLSIWSFPKYVRVPINKLPLEDAAAILVSTKPEAVVGYPSFLQSLSEVLDERGGTRVVFVTGEILGDSSRKVIESKFCGNLIDTYGCTEVGDIAWECPDEHSGYHLNSDLVFVEFIRDGESVSGEEEGEIVLTDLTNTAMPFIRYRIGDTGVPSGELCSCGRTLPLMRVLKGRSDDFVVLPSGRKISPLALLDLNAMKGILQFRVVQKSHRLIELWTIVRKDMTDKNLQKFAFSVKEVVGEDVEVQVRQVSEIPKDKSGKLRRIVSEV